MEIEPANIFERRDIIGARRLNRVLKVLPRYHTGRRQNARMINFFLDVGHWLVPRRTTSSLAVHIAEVPTADRSLRLRILRDAPSPRAVCLHFHGGAWVLGNARIDDHWNAQTARACKMTVISGDFHLATDNDLEHAIRDAMMIVEWVLDHLRELGADRLLVEGESSGAHLAACAMVRLAKRRPLEQIAGFVSFCGAFDMEGSQSLRSSGDESLIINARSARRNLHRLTSRPMRAAARAPEISPYLADLSGMPPALFISGALDPIRDDSRKMYVQWQRCSGNAEIVVVPEAPHGFERLPTRLAKRTRAYMFDWVTRLLEADCGPAGDDVPSSQPPDELPGTGRLSSTP